MASVEMVQIDRCRIFSPVTPSSNSKLSSLNATLNSPAEGSVLLSAKAPTIEDLNQLNGKLTEVQLFSADESKDDMSVAHRVYVSSSLQAPVYQQDAPFSRDDAAQGYAQGGSVSCLPRFRREGGVPILLDFTNAVFQSFEDTSSDDANKTPSATVDGNAHSGVSTTLFSL